MAKRRFSSFVVVWKENTGLTVTNNKERLFSKEPLARTLHTKVKKTKKNNDCSKSVAAFVPVQICRTSFRLDTIQLTIVHHAYTTLAVISLIQ